MAKGGSKLIVGIVAFLLGFIFAIIAEVGAIFGVYWYVTSQDIDTILAAVGLPNRDADGNNIYINTDEDNGGAKTVMELFAKLRDLFFEDGQFSALGKSFNDFEELLPATSIVLNMIYSAVDDYIELDREAFESSPLTEIAQVLSDSVMNVRVGSLLEKFNSNIAESGNIILKSLLFGAETEYATVSYASSARAASSGSSGLQLPVMYDIYEYSGKELGWFRNHKVDGNDNFPANLTDRIDEQIDFIETTTKTDAPDGDLTYTTANLCYVPCVVTPTEIQPARYTIESFGYEGSDGKTYTFRRLVYDDDTDFIAVKANAEGNYVLSHSDIVNAPGSNPNAEASLRYPGYSYDEAYARNYYVIEKNADTEKYELNTISGKNYFRDPDGSTVQLDPLTLSDLINNAFGPLYSVAVTDVVGDNAEVVHQLFGKTTLGDLLDGNVDFDNLIDDMEISSIVNNVAWDNKLMAYIVFKLSDVQKISDDTCTAIYDQFGENEQEVTVKLDGVYIDAVYDKNGELIPGVKVTEIATIADNMTLNLLMDMSADDAILAYLGYGVTDLVEAESADETYTHTGKIKVDGEYVDCYVATYMQNGKPIIHSVWYVDEDGAKVAVKSTSIESVSDRVENLTSELSIGAIIKIDDNSNQLLKSLKDTKISKLGDKIDELTIKDLFSETDIEKSDILRQLKNSTLNSLAEDIDKVLIQRIYAEDIYGVAKGSDPKLATTNAEYAEDDNYYYTESFNESLLYYELVDGVYQLVEINCEGLEGAEREKELGHLTTAQFEEGKYYTFGEAKGMWKLILYSNGREQAYHINNFNNMISASTSNIYNATLGELYDAGIIKDDIRGKKFTYQPIDGERNTVELESLSLMGLIEIVISMSTSA